MAVDQIVIPDPEFLGISFSLSLGFTDSEGDIIVGNDDLFERDKKNKFVLEVQPLRGWRRGDG